MLQALLGSADLTPEDVEIIEYPDFTQRIAVSGRVPSTPRRASRTTSRSSSSSTGDPAVVLRIDDITPLPGPGLIAGTATLDTKGDAIAAFVAATLRAMDEIKADPSVGLEAAIVAVPELEATPRHAGRRPRRDDRLVGRPDPGGVGPRAPSTRPAGPSRSRS